MNDVVHIQVSTVGTVASTNHVVMGTGTIISHFRGVMLQLQKDAGTPSLAGMPVDLSEQMLECVNADVRATIRRHDDAHDRPRSTRRWR